MHKSIIFVTTVLTMFLLQSCIDSFYSERKFKKNDLVKPYDVIIVPGVPYTETGTMQNIFDARIMWAKYLYDSGYTNNIIFSGSAVESPYYEGAVMKMIADSLGIPSEHTFAETKAEHSTENVYYSCKMAYLLGFKKIALATDPFQTIMLRGFIKRHCPNIGSMPINFKKIDPEKKKFFIMPKIDAQSAFVPNFIPLSQREGFWKRLKGTRGKNIKFE